MKWYLESWQKFKIRQNPKYYDQSELATIEQKLCTLPPLILPQEILKLKNLLENFNTSDNYFIIHAGDCAESFAECNLHNTKKHLAILNQMSQILTDSTNKKIILIGRFAGQFAKPRSQQKETQGKIILPSYRGDMINEVAFTKEARVAKPINLLKGYNYAYQKIKYLDVIYKNTKAKKIYTSHEALLLNYEQAMTKKIEDEYYNLSAHMLWIGNRTRNPKEAHIEYIRGIANPIAIKIGPEITPKELIELIVKVNSANLILISRIGAKKIRNLLPQLMRLTKKEKYNIIWICDPMHGNTAKMGKLKIRKYEDIISEAKQFFEISKEEKIYPAGIHLEITEQEVEECDVLQTDKIYRCDPRLNCQQSLNFTYFLSEQIKSMQ